MSSKRRDVRYEIRCPTELTYGRKTSVLVSEDVSYRGVFVRTDSPPALRQLVRVAIRLSGEEELVTHGMVVHVVEPSIPSGRTPGAGVQYYALDAKLRQTWETFSRDVASRSPPSGAHALPTIGAGGPEPVRRQATRYQAVLPVRVKTLLDLLELYARDVSTGGMFIETDHALEAGAEVVVHVHHPQTDGTLSLPAVVRHRQESGAIIGVGVEFVGVDREKREEFLKFVRAGVEPEEDSVFIDEDDPLLL